MAINFIWNNTYSVGVAEFDEQHKQLFETILALNSAINNNLAKEKMDEILASLDHYVDVHFSAEEKYFDKFNYEFSAEHKDEHQVFVSKLLELKEKCKDHETEVSFEMIDFLEDWLLDHVLTSDRKYMECFAKNGLK